VPKGSASSTDSGSDHFSYCAARIRKTMTTRQPSAKVDAPLDFFSWYDAPPQSKLKSGGSTSSGDLLDTAMPWPELMPGAVWPMSLTAGRLLKRSSESGPEVCRHVASADSGTISPFCART
jgi:hypothetical protein